jgi:heptosyltransferase-2/heptosyltransferase-3
MAYLSRIPRRIGYDIPEVRPFLTDVVPYVQGRHEVEQNLTLVESVGGRPVAYPLEFRPSASDEEFAASYLAERGVKGKEPLICIHPGAGAPVKLWLKESWAQVADALAQRYGAKVILTGSGEEVPLCQAICELMANEAIVAAGDTSLGELAAIMARSSLVIGTDSGPLHLAVAVGTPSVHLYGPVDVHTFGPWGDPSFHIALTSRLDCIPCNRLDYSAEEIEEHPCVRSISVEMVLEAAHRLLSRRSSYV